MSDREGIPVPVVSGPDGAAKLPAAQRAIAYYYAGVSPLELAERAVTSSSAGRGGTLGFALPCRGEPTRLLNADFDGVGYAAACPFGAAVVMHARASERLGCMTTFNRNLPDFTGVAAMACHLTGCDHCRSHCMQRQEHEMRMLVLAMITALGTAALVGPANAQSTRPPVTPPAVDQPAQQPGGLACSQGRVWLPAYWDRLNVYHRGQCISLREYNRLYGPPIHS
jgi:hypothetical protein